MALKTYLPDFIQLQTGEKLTPYVGTFNTKELIMMCKARGAKYRKIEVLPRSLRGKNDLRGRPYQPTEWVFTNLDNI